MSDFSISMNTRIDQPMKHDIQLGCLVPWVDQSLHHLTESHQLYNHNTSPNIDNEMNSIIVKFN